MLLLKLLSLGHGSIINILKELSLLELIKLELASRFKCRKISNSLLILYKKYLKEHIYELFKNEYDKNEDDKNKDDKNKDDEENNKKQKINNYVRCWLNYNLYNLILYSEEKELSINKPKFEDKKKNNYRIITYYHIMTIIIYFEYYNYPTYVEYKISRDDSKEEFDKIDKICSDLKNGVETVNFGKIFFPLKNQIRYIKFDGNDGKLFEKNINNKIDEMCNKLQIIKINKFIYNK